MWNTIQTHTDTHVQKHLTSRGKSHLSHSVSPQLFANVQHHQRFLGTETSLECDWDGLLFTFSFWHPARISSLLVAHLRHSQRSVPLLIESPTKSSVPLLQEFHFDNLIERWSILQFIYESCHQVLVVAREDAQMVSGFVAQAVVVVCVEPHNYGGTTAKSI